MDIKPAWRTVFLNRIQLKRFWLPFARIPLGSPLQSKSPPSSPSLPDIIITFVLRSGSNGRLLSTVPSLTDGHAIITRGTNAHEERGGRANSVHGQLRSYLWDFN